MSVRCEKMVSKYAGLAWKFQVNPNSCDNPNHYETYLRCISISDQQSGLGTTHVLIEKNESTQDEKIIGFVTLRASSLVKMYDDYHEGHSALEISELAVANGYERQGIGAALIAIAIDHAKHLNNEHLGIEFITLCADISAVGFYSNPKIGFGKLEDFYELPREHWNINCKPMLMKLHT